MAQEGISSEATADPIDAAGAQNELCFWIHILALLGALFPFGNLVGPLIIWIIKKDDNAEADRHGREVLAFHGSLIIYAIGFLVLAMIPIMGWLFAILMIPVILIFLVYVIYLVVKGALAARRGELFRYPMKLKFVIDAVQSL